MLHEHDHLILFLEHIDGVFGLVLIHDFKPKRSRIEHLISAFDHFGLPDEIVMLIASSSSSTSSDDASISSRLSKNTQDTSISIGSISVTSGGVASGSVGLVQPSTDR